MLAEKKFPHLDNKDPNPDNMKKLLVDQIFEWNYPQVKAHFEWLKEKYSSNKKVASAASEILAKIDIIMNLWKSRFSWEIMSATADDYKNKMAV
jgi:hypothetical protein